jgi:hypothetical protein
MSRLTVYQDKETWKAARLTMITATEMASLLGLGYKNSKGYQVNTPQAIMKAKKTGVSPVMNDFNGIMQRGTILEPAIGLALEIRLGWEMLYPDRGTWEVYTLDKDRVGATPDCYRREEDGTKTVVECKSVGVWAKNETGSLELSYAKWESFQKHPPLYYIVQVLHQLRCTKKKVGFLVGMLAIDPMPTVVFRVVLSDKLDEEMEQAALTFWNCFDSDEKYVVNKDKVEYLANLVMKSCKRIY